MNRRAVIGAALLLAANKAFARSVSYHGGIRNPAGTMPLPAIRSPEHGAQPAEGFYFAGRPYLSASGYLPFNRDVSRFIARSHAQLRSNRERNTQAYINLINFLDPVLVYFARRLDILISPQDIFLDTSIDNVLSVRASPTKIHHCGPSNSRCHEGMLGRIFHPVTASRFFWTAEIDGWVGYSRSVPTIVSARANINLSIWTEHPLQLDSIVNRLALDEESKTIMLEIMQIYDAHIRSPVYRGLRLIRLPSNFEDRFLPVP